MAGTEWSTSAKDPRRFPFAVTRAGDGRIFGQYAKLAEARKHVEPGGQILRHNPAVGGFAVVRPEEQR